MNINSLVVRARPERLAQVSGAMATLPGVQVHHCDPAGRLLVTVEGSAGQPAADTILGIHRIDGVLGATLVYQYDDEPAPVPRPPIPRQES